MRYENLRSRAERGIRSFFLFVEVPRPTPGFACPRHPLAAAWATTAKRSGPKLALPGVAANFSSLGRTRPVHQYDFTLQRLPRSLLFVTSKRLEEGGREPKPPSGAPSASFPQAPAFIADFWAGSLLLLLLQIYLNVPHRGFYQAHQARSPLAQFHLLPA